MSFNYLLSGFAMCGSFLIISTNAVAEPLKWPTEHHLRLPLIAVVGPGRAQSIAYSVGVVSEWTKPDWNQNDDRNSFRFLALNAKWTSPKVCDDSVRPHGYIHTDALILNQNDALQFAVPLEFKLSGIFRPEAAERVLDWPLLSISLLKLIKNKNQNFLKEIKNKLITVRDLQLSKFNTEGSGNTETHLSINYNELLVSDVIRMKKRSNYRIRIEWAADNICGESAFSLKIGDQIRIFRNDQGHVF